MSETSAIRAATLVALVATLGVTTAHWVTAHRTNEQLTNEISRLTREQGELARAVQLFRFERGSKGLGATALIEQLRFWAPLLDLSTTPQREINAIQAKVADILQAFEDIGKDAYDPTLAAFRQAKPTQEDELRRWLLEAMIRVDRDRARELLATCVRGWEFDVTPRVRLIAGHQLLDLDKPHAAKLLSEIMRYESGKGIDRSRLSPELQQKLAALPAPPEQMKMFFNLVDLFVATGAADVEEQLLVVATRPDQDLTTVQTCVKHLGQLRAKRASKAIRKLFDAPPEMTINPIFQNHCLDAIAAIDGAEACDYFREQLRRGPDERVLAKLQDLLKTHCK